MPITVETLALAWLTLANVVGFLLMGADKGRARRDAWRIPERTMFLTALLGGSAGVWAGMYAFRHKTRHWYFVWGVPLILAAQLVLLYWLKTNLL